MGQLPGDSKGAGYHWVFPYSVVPTYIRMWYAVKQSKSNIKLRKCTKNHKWYETMADQRKKNIQYSTFTKYIYNHKEKI